MKSTKTFNNISDELKKQIPKLKPGEAKTFLMLNGTPNPDPDPREQSKDPMIYGKRQLRTNFRIYDKDLKDEKGNVVGGYVDVGAVERWNGNEPEKFRMIVPGMDMGSRFQGKFSLMGGKVEDEEIFEILYLSPEREGTPCPDESITPLFRLLDFKNETKQANTKFDILKKAIKIAEEIKEEKALEVMSALNQPAYQDKDVLISKTRDFARLHPDQFISAYESAETPIKATVRSAVDAGILDHDIASGEVKLAGVKLTTMKLEATESFVQVFSAWINSADNGKSILNNIKNQLSKVNEVSGKK